jgi:hypothetical protein
MPVLDTGIHCVFVKYCLDCRDKPGNDWSVAR